MNIQRYILSLILASALLISGNAVASTLVEPTLDTDGSALDDLQSCTVVVTENFSGTTGSKTFGASSPSGGGSHDYDPASILPTGIREVTETAICSDTGGLESAPSNTLATFRPDGMSPAAPTLTP